MLVIVIMVVDFSVLLFFDFVGKGGCGFIFLGLRKFGVYEEVRLVLGLE